MSLRINESERNGNCLFLIILILTFSITFISCSDDSNDVTNPYIPSQLPNSTWGVVSSPEAVGWSSEKL